jgi:hypothetical protein
LAAANSGNITRLDAPGGEAPLSGEVARRPDVRLLQGKNEHRRDVVDLKDVHDVRAYLLCVDLDQRADVGEGHVVRATHHFGDGVSRAVTAIDLNVHAGTREVSAVRRQHEGRLLALDGEVENEPHGRGLRQGMRTRDAQQDCGNARSHQSRDHGCTPRFDSARRGRA